MNASEKEKLEEALKKKAYGYLTTEQNEEYAVVDGEMSLIKKKISIKEVAPELAAIKILMEEGGDNFDSMTEEELTYERDRLLLLLKKTTKAYGKEKS